MKKVLFFLVFWGVVDFTFAQGPNMFNSREEAEKAFSEGKFEYYVPKYFSNHGVNPVDWKQTFGIALTKPAIVEIETIDGIKFVIQPIGIILRWKKLNEKMVPYARDDCGNKIYSIYYLSPIPLRLVSQVSGPPGAKGDKGDKGDLGPQGFPGINVEESSFLPWWGWALIGAGIAILVDYTFFHDTSPVYIPPTVSPPGVDTGGAN